jgi:hypothetical protein
MIFTPKLVSVKKTPTCPTFITEFKLDLLFLQQNNNIMSNRKYFDDSTVALGTLYTIFLMGVILAIVFFG